MKTVRAFLLGFIVMMVLDASLVTSCIQEFEEPELKDVVDYGSIKKANKLVEEAFLSGDPVQVDSMLTEQARERYAAELYQIPSSKLIEFGQLYNQAKIEYAYRDYAEITFPVNGSNYTVQLALQDDGTYKIMNY